MYEIKRFLEIKQLTVMFGKGKRHILQNSYWEFKQNKYKAFTLNL